MTLILNTLDAQNYDAAYRLQRSCHAYPWSRKVFADCLTEPYFAYQALLDKQVVGFFVGLQVLDEVTLMDIGITAAQRGTGLGQKLLANFIQMSRERQAANIWLEVRQSNLAAQHIYQKAGFQLLETRKNYYPTAEGREDALIMQLLLGGRAA